MMKQFFVRIKTEVGGNCKIDIKHALITIFMSSMSRNKQTSIYQLCHF